MTIDIASPGAEATALADAFHDILGDYATKAALEAASVPSGLDRVRIRGYATENDSPAAFYKRASSEPSHAGKVQSADGAWWELHAPDGRVHAGWFGALGGGVTDDADALNDALDYLAGLNRVPGEKGSRGGTLVLDPNRYLVRRPLYVSQFVSIQGAHRNQTYIVQDEQSCGCIFYLVSDNEKEVENGTSLTFVRDLALRGENAGIVNRTMADTTASSADVTVADATGIEVGYTVEMQGVPRDTVVTAVSGTTITLDSTVSHTLSDTAVAFRRAYEISLTTTDGSTTATVADATNVKEGQLVRGENILPWTFITAVSGTTITLGRAATGTGTADHTFEEFNCGIYTEPPTDEATQKARSAVIENVQVEKMAGPGIHIFLRSQARLYLSQVLDCFAEGIIINSANDSQIVSCGAGGNWRTNLYIATAASARVVSCDAWMQKQADKYYCVRSQENGKFTAIGCDFEGGVYAKAQPDYDYDAVTFVGVSFMVEDRSFPETTGALDAYFFNDGIDPVRLIGCSFIVKDTEKPDYLVDSAGDAVTYIHGPYANGAVNTGVASDLAKVQVALTGRSNPFTILGTGDVGIGKIPNFELDVDGTVNAPYIDAWKFFSLPINYTAQFSDKDSNLNTNSKKQKGAMTLNADTVEIMVATGDTPTSSWKSMVDGGLITPS